MAKKKSNSTSSSMSIEQKIQEMADQARSGRDVSDYFGSGAYSQGNRMMTAEDKIRSMADDIRAGRPYTNYFKSDRYSTGSRNAALQPARSQFDITNQPTGTDEEEFDRYMKQYNRAQWRNEFRDASLKDLQEAIANEQDEEKRSWLQDYMEMDSEWLGKRSSAEIDEILQGVKGRMNTSQYEAAKAAAEKGMESERAAKTGVDRELSGRAQGLEWARNIADRNEWIDRKYGGYTNDPDFDNAAAAGQARKNSSLQEMREWGMMDPEQQSMAQRPVVGNRLEYYLANKDTEGAEFYDHTILLGLAGSWYFISQDERNMYNYLLQTQGEKAADTYLEDIGVFLDQRASRAQAEQNAANYADYNMAQKIAANAVGIPARVFGGAINSAAQIGSAINGAITGEHRFNPYLGGGLQQLGQDILQNTSEDLMDWVDRTEEDKLVEDLEYQLTYLQQVRNSHMSMEELDAMDASIQSVSARLEEAKKAQQAARDQGKGNLEDHSFAAKLLSNTYQALMSGADSALGAAMMGNGYTLMMASSSASQRARELYEAGASGTQIALGAFASGFIEYATERWSVEQYTENFLKNDIATFDEWAKNTLILAFNEGSEEIASELANMVTNAIILGGNSDNQREIREMMVKQGLSYEEARKQAVVNRAVDSLWAFYGGAISGGAMGGIGGVTNAVQSNAMYNSLGAQTEFGGQTEQLVREAKDSDAYNKNGLFGRQTAYQKLTDKVAARAENGESNFRDTGRLYAMTQDALTEQDTGRIRQAASDRLTEIGAEGNTDRLADIISKKVAGEELTAREKRLLNKSAAAKQVLEELNSYDSKQYGELLSAQEGARNDAEAALKPVVDSDYQDSGAKAAYAEANEKSKAADKAVKDYETDPSRAWVQKIGTRVINPGVYSSQSLQEQSRRFEDPKARAAFQAAYMDGQDVAQYANDFAANYMVGASNGNFEAARQNYGGSLNDTQARAAYETGKTARRSALVKEFGGTNENNQSESGERNDRKHSGRPIFGLGSRTGTNPTGETVRAGQSGNESQQSEAGKFSAGQEVSEADLGLGSSTAKDLIVVGDDYNDDIRSIRQKASDRGLNAVFLYADKPFGTGNYINVGTDTDSKYIQGEYDSATNTIYVQVNSGVADAVKIADHEITHDMIRKGEISVEDVLAQLKEQFQDDPEKVRQILDSYSEAYAGAGDLDILEEVVCDALAGMNMFQGTVDGVNTYDLLRDVRAYAEESQETIRKATEEQTDKGHGAEATNIPDVAAQGTDPVLNVDAEPTTDVANVTDVSRHSYVSLAQAAGFEATMDESGLHHFVRDGKMVKNVTVEDIENSPIGALINFSAEMGDFGKAGSKEAKEAAAAQKQFFADICTLAAGTNDFNMGMQFAGSSVFMALKANADKQYGTSYDLPSICTKTQALIDSMSAAMVEAERGLTSEEITLLADKVFYDGNPIPCPECYVFSHWIGIGGLLDNINKYQTRFGSMTQEQVEAEYQKMSAKIEAFAKENGLTFGKAKGQLASKFTKEYRKVLVDVEKKQNQGEDVSDKRLNELKMLGSQMDTVKAMTWIDTVYFKDSAHKKVNPRRNVPASVLFDLNQGEAFASEYPEAWAFRTTQGAGYGKAITPYADAVLGEGILGTANLSATTKAKKAGNLVNPFLKQKGQLDANTRRILMRARQKQLNQAFLGGQRLQSTSDALYENSSDYLLAFLEIQAMHGMAQVYTKVPGAVPAFAVWGASTNQSLMPKGRGLDSNNKPIDTDTGGMNPKIAKKNRLDFDTQGTITIGVNDKHIRALFNEHWRDFIIPYHASGGKANIVNRLREIQDNGDLEITRSTDYTNTQSDKQLSDEVLIWQGRGDELERIHALRDARIAILTRGKPDMQVVRSNRFLSALYDKLNGGEWDGVKLAKGTIATHIFPNEFWDQSVNYAQSGKITQDYLEYCNDLGFLHRFSGMRPSNGILIPVQGYNENGIKVPLTDLAYQYDENGNKTGEIEPYFWKVLTDRRMYDNKGKYLPQKYVNVTNTTQSTLTEFAQNGRYTLMGFDAGRQYNAKLSEKTVKEITPWFTDGSKKHSAVSDSEGRQLSEQQEKFFQDSKVRDDNGNLMVMYHGSGRAGFHVFNPKKSDDRRSLFFTNKLHNAASYSGSFKEYSPSKVRTLADYNKATEGTGYTLKNLLGKYQTYYEGDFIAEYDSPQLAFSDFLADHTDEQTNYKVYLNITNPLVIDAKGAQWDEIRWQTDRYKEAQKKAHDAFNYAKELKKNGDSRYVRAFEYALDLQSAADDIGEEDGAFSEWNTRKISEKAVKDGYDGVILQNVVDYGDAANVRTDPATVAIAFNSEQVKSVANTEPTDNPDIRYSTVNDPSSDDFSVSDDILLDDFYNGDYDIGNWTSSMKAIAKEIGWGSKNNESSDSAGADVRDGSEGTGSERSSVRVRENAEHRYASSDASMDKRESSGQGSNSGKNKRHRRPRVIGEYNVVGTKAVMSNERLLREIADSTAGNKQSYAQKWITSINPSAFIDMTTKKSTQKRSKFDTMPGEYGSTTAERNFIPDLQNSKQSPYLIVDYKTGKIYGHEGRHRMRSLEMAGVASADVLIVFADRNGARIKEVNGYNNPIDIIQSLEVENQVGTKQAVVLNNIIPLNNAFKEQVLSNYGESRSDSGEDIKFSTVNDTQVAAADPVAFEAVGRQLRSVLKQYEDRTLEAGAAKEQLAEMEAALMQEAKSHQEDVDMWRYESSALISMLRKSEGKVSDLLKKLDQRNAEIRQNVKTQKDMARESKENEKLMTSEFLRVVKEYEKQGHELRSTQEGAAKLAQMLSDEVKKHKGDNATWEREFKRLQREYERADRSADKLEAALKERRRKEKLKVESRKQTQIRNKIKKLYGEFQGIIDHPSAALTKHAPRELIQPLAEFCGMFAMHEMEYRNTQERAAIGKGASQNKLNQIQRAKNALTDIISSYTALQGKEGLTGAIYNEDAVKMLRDLSQTMDEWLRNEGIHEMSSDDLQAVYDTMRKIQHTIVDANRLLSMSKFATVYDVSKRWYQQMNDTSSFKSKQGKALQRYMMWQLRPGNMFQYTCGFVKNNVGNDIDQMFWRGTERMLTVQRDYDAKFNEIINRSKETVKEVKDLGNTKKLVYFGLKDISGKKVMTTRGMMLSAYKLLSQEDSLRSLAYGGLKLPDMDEYYHGNIKAAYGGAELENLLSATPAESISELEKQIAEIKSRAKAGEISPTDAALQTADLEIQIDQLVEGEEARLLEMRSTIQGMLTPLEQELLDASDEWMEHSGDLVADTFYQLNGYDMKRVENYWTIHRDHTTIASLDTTSIVNEFNLANSGMTQERVKARQPILLTDFFQELNGNRAKVSRYVGFATVQQDFNKVWKMKNTGSRYSIQGMVEAKFQTGSHRFGVSGAEYVENYLKSISGANISDNGIFGGLYSAAAGATLSANIRVALSQLASIPTAAAEVGWTNMAKGVAAGAKIAFNKDARELQAQQSVWYWQRYRGEGSTTEVADLRKNGGIWGQVANSKVGKAVFNWCQDMDALATGPMMWKMAEFSVQERGMKPGDDGYLQACKDRYADIIRRTQPNYTETERSDLLRDKRTSSKILTMYKTQSNQNLNILIDANATFLAMRRDFKNGKNGVTAEDVEQAKRKLANAYTGVLIGGTFAFAAIRWIGNAIQRTMNAYRDDETDEVTTEATLKGIIKDALSSFFGMFAIGSQIFDLVYASISGDQYYGMSDSALGVLSDSMTDLYNVARAVESGDISKMRKRSGELVKDGLTAMGVPAGNIQKILSMMDGWYGEIRSGDLFAYESGKTTSSQYHARYVNAFRDGDKEKMGALAAMWLLESKEDDPEKAAKDVQSKMATYLQKHYAKGTVDGIEAVQILEGMGMDMDDAAQKVARWEFAENYPDAPGWSKKADVVDYINKLPISSSEKRKLWDSVKGTWKDKDTPWE